MERTEIVLLEKENGYQRKKISFINPPSINFMGLAHGYFTKDQKKIAKLNHKNRIN